MSTLVEQIAAVKDAVETYEAEAVGYENGARTHGGDSILLKEAALYRRSETAMRAALATLEGLATPGETLNDAVQKVVAERADKDRAVMAEEARRFDQNLEGQLDRFEEAVALMGSADAPDPQQPTPEALRSLLQRAERLWEELQDNELGGFSGINRPFWIVQAFKEVEAAAVAKARREAIHECAMWLAPNFPGQARDMERALSPVPQNPGDANER